jgi:Peptidase inhibitor I78 family
MQLSRSSAPLGAVFLAIFLSACAAPAPRRVVVTQPPVGPSVNLPTDPTPGFNDKEPDTCKSQTMLGLIGQPSGNVRTVRTPGPVRIIAPGTVYDQEEYRSDRVNVFIDGAGIITRISCG